MTALSLVAGLLFAVLTIAAVCKAIDLGIDCAFRAEKRRRSRGRGQ
jgi:hypothetical protein